MLKLLEVICLSRIKLPVSDVYRLPTLLMPIKPVIKTVPGD